MNVNICVVNADSVKDISCVKKKKKRHTIANQFDKLNMHSFVICEALIYNLNI